MLFADITAHVSNLSSESVGILIAVVFLVLFFMHTHFGDRHTRTGREIRQKRQQKRAQKATTKETDRTRQ